MKSFKKYLTPEEQIKELSLTEKAWQAAKQKIAENKELNAEEQELIDKFLGIEPAYEPDDGALTEEQIEKLPVDARKEYRKLFLMKHEKKNKRDFDRHQNNEKLK